MPLDPVNLFDYEARAKLALSHDHWDFIDAGAMDEFTTRRNRTAFEELSLRPRFMRDVSERNISTTVLGQEISMPVMISPAGSHMMAHPEGEVATAKGAGKSDTLMMLSVSSNNTMEEVAEATIECLLRVVPSAVPGICFLSGGQSDLVATQHLNAMNAMTDSFPWKLSFSYGRALQSAALKTWGGKTENIPAAQKAFYHRAKCNGAATLGQYSDEMEN